MHFTKYLIIRSHSPELIPPEEGQKLGPGIGRMGLIISFCKLGAVITIINRGVALSLVAVKNTEIMENEAGDDDLRSMPHLSETDASSEDVEPLFHNSKGLLN